MNALKIILLFCLLPRSRSPRRRPCARDGQHDFDWEIGTWKTHLKRLKASADRLDHLARIRRDDSRHAKCGTGARIWWSST